MEERVELRREDHVRDEDPEPEREEEAVHRVGERRALTAHHDAVADGQVLHHRLDERHRLGLGVPRRDVAEDRDRALSVGVRNRLEHRKLDLRRHGGERDHLPARGPHVELHDVLRPLALRRQQAEDDVDAAPSGRVEPDLLAAHQRAHGVGDVRDGDAEVRGARPIGDDLELGGAELVVGVDVGRQPALRQLRPYEVRLRRQDVPVGAAHRELERIAALPREALLREILHRRAKPWNDRELFADDGAEIILRDLSILRIDQRHRQGRRVPRHARHDAVDLFVLVEDGLAPAGDFVGLVEIGADLHRESNREPALVLRGDELARKMHRHPDRRGEDGARDREDDVRDVQRPGEGARVDLLELREAAIDGAAEPCALSVLGVEDLRAA